MILLWVLYVLCVSCLSVVLSCLIFAALWSPAGKRADLLALLYVMLFCVLLISHTVSWVLGQAWYLIVSV